MYFIDFLFAFGIALVVALLFTFVFKRASAWPFILFFLLIFLGTWALGVWITPIGPHGWTYYWLPFLLASLIVVLLLTLIIPDRPYRVRIWRSRSEMQERKGTEVVLGFFFWFLVLLLIGTLLLGYL